MRTWMLVATAMMVTLPPFIMPACNQEDDDDQSCEANACDTVVTTTSGGATSTASGSGGGMVQTYRWTFDDVQAGEAPPEFAPALGDWSVQADDQAPSAPNVLRQTGVFGDPDFPRIIVDSVTFSDLTLSVRCRPEEGAIDRACGLMFRLQDGANYYITRANALENNVRLYRVVDGVRQQFASAARQVTAGEWHTLAATARGSDLTVSWDGEQVIAASDATFASGKIGLWTKADSVTAFDDFEASAQ